MPYAVLDERIIEAIRSGFKSYSTIEEHLNRGKKAKDLDFTPGPLIERRLLALKRRGRILYTGSATRSAWQLKDTSA